MTDTVLDRIVEILDRAGRRTSPDQELPAAVLWPDPAREFEGVISRIAARLSVVTLGQYNPDSKTGPAIWVRWVLGGTVPHIQERPGGPFIIYLPGWSRDDIRDVADGPDELRPLADLQYRGIIWLNKSREWTARSLVGDASVGLDVSSEMATREALLRALPRLLDEPIAELQTHGELDSQFFNDLLAPDHERLLLLWLNDPAGIKLATDSVQWSAFRDTCRDKYQFDPETDGPVIAARMLGGRRGSWAKVWAAFEDVPQRYPLIPDRLRSAQPHELIPEPQGSWPAVNEQFEAKLRGELGEFSRLTPAEAHGKVHELDSLHGQRRSWVWARLGLAPLAIALEHLVKLADMCATPLEGVSAKEIGDAYASHGWKADRAAMNALAAAETSADGDGVGTAVRALYEGWLDAGARALQAGFAKTIPTDSHDDHPAGTCVLFIDGLRFDVARMVEDELAGAAQVSLEWRFAAIPTVTPTAKPSVSPVANRLFAGPYLSASATDGGTALNVEGLRKVLEANGWQVLGEGGLGDPSGRAWLEGGDIDSEGHTFPAKLPLRLRSEARDIADRILELLSWGWFRVVVVTDHGWLHLPGGLPKVALPINNAEIRKGRCARVPANAKVDHLTLPWRWNAIVRIAIAPGIASYESGKVYEHGGVSPQECVTPRLLVQPAKGSQPEVTAKVTSLIWLGMRCRIEAEAPEGAKVDIRTKPADATSSIASESRPLEGVKCSLVVPDDRLEGSTATVVIVDKAGTVVAQRHTTIGINEQ